MAEKPDQGVTRAGGLAQTLRVLPFCALGLLSYESGCARARTRVQAPTGHIEPTMEVAELPKTAPRSKNKDVPWYNELIDRKAAPAGQAEGVDTKNDTPAEVVEVINLDDPAGVKNYWNPQDNSEPATPSSLLEEVLKGVLANQPKNATWTPLRLKLLARDPRHPGTLRIEFEIVQKNLYLRRPEISFDRVRLEECMTRLATQAGLRHAQTRAHNPVITWRKENVSVIEAAREVLDTYGFEHRFSGAYRNILIKVKDHASRSAFVDATVKEVIQGGQSLERDVPTLIVWPKETKLKTEKEKEKEKEDADREKGSKKTPEDKDHSAKPKSE